MTRNHTGIWVLRPSLEGGLAARRLYAEVFESKDDAEQIGLESLTLERRNHPGNLEPEPLIEKLVEAQLDQDRIRLVLDLGSLRKADSSGLGELVAAVRRTAEAGGEMVLANPTSKTRRLLERTQIDRMIPIYDSVLEAIQHFRDRPRRRNRS